MHEQRPDEPQPVGLSTGAAEPRRWQPDEQTGDMYQVETTDQGQIERLEPPPSIWVGSWLDYNNGVLYGDWIRADRAADAVLQDITAMLASSPTAASSGQTAEDWGIFDHDNFGVLRIGEQESIDWISAVARGIAEHGLVFAAYADVVEEQAALPGFADAYLGHYDSLTAYAEQLVEDAGYDERLDQAVPDGLRPYVQFDCEALGRDMQIGGDVHVIAAIEGGIWIFDAH